jgi:hypothetical protein
MSARRYCHPCVFTIGARTVSVAANEIAHNGLDALAWRWRNGMLGVWP